MIILVEKCKQGKWFSEMWCMVHRKISETCIKYLSYVGSNSFDGPHPGHEEISKKHLSEALQY